jgi:hypothetical protein
MPRINILYRRSGKRRSGNRRSGNRRVTEYFDSLDKFSERKLPLKEAFYSRLTEEGISDDEYHRALEVWEALGCQTFKDYHDFYLKTDVLLLADVSENFREMGMQYYDLDPAQYLILPSYS